MNYSKIQQTYGYFFINIWEMTFERFSANKTDSFYFSYKVIVTPTSTFDQKFLKSYNGKHLPTKPRHCVNRSQCLEPSHFQPKCPKSIFLNFRPKALRQFHVSFATDLS